MTNQFGIFALALAPDSSSDGSEPFPAVTLKATSSPETVQAGEDVTHTLSFTNNGTTAVAQLNVKEVLGVDLDYLSVTPTQGACKQKGANNVVVCHLGPLLSGASATVTLVSRSRNLFFKDSTGKTESSRIAINTLEVVSKTASTEDGPVYHRFRAMTENSSGLFSLTDRVLVI